MPVTQTAADVRLITANSQEPKVLFGESVIPGDWVFYDETDRTYKKAQSDNDVEEAAVSGMCLSYAISGTYGHIAKDGVEVDPGAALTQGTSYFASGTPGKMCVDAEVTAGLFVTSLGVGLANGNLLIQINATGVAKP